MSTAGPTDPRFNFAPATPGPGSTADETSVDPVLIQQTKNEIRGLVQEITQLSQSDLPVDRFYEAFLSRIVQALASPGGAIWTLEDDGSMRLAYQTNLPSDTLVDHEEGKQRHATLLRNVVASGQPTVVPPRSGSAGEAEAGNPTDYLLVLATLRVEQQPVAVIEVFQRAGGGPTTQRGYLRFVVQMAELASDFLKNRRLRQFSDRQDLWENLERFIRRIHDGLDTRETAFTIVNEGRRLIRSDRVSLALRRGRKQQVVAVSGLDTIDRRAEEVRRLGKLATVVAAGKRPLWYSGASEEIPPQIEDPLHEYVDRSHATTVAVIPLFRPARDEVDEASSHKEPIGTLIVEQLGDHRVHEGQHERVETVALHSSAALCNALDHESVFLMPLWRSLGKLKWVTQARNLPKVVLVIGALVGIALALIMIPADFDMSSKGKLRPSTRHVIFAHIGGVITEVPVKHEETVSRGQILVRMKNNELDTDIATLIGRKRTTLERIHSLERLQLNARRERIEEQNRLAGELLELSEVDQNIDRELQLMRKKEEQLVIRSELDGQVVTWNVGEKLLRRPVQIGQALMTVVDPSGDWELELYMPERRMGHIARAARELPDGLTVTFVLASHPGLEFTGRVVEVHRSAEVRGEEGNTVLIRAAIDKDELPELRSETTVTARLNCGRRPIGYVLFHELMETVHSKVLFWL